jgi:hypothetical protein
MHRYYVMLRIDQGRNNLPQQSGAERNPAMILDSLMTRARDSFAKRKRYNRLVAEIDSFTSRDLADMRADRSEMLYQVHKQIYG